MYWILFRRETDNVHYLWNGLWPICVHVPAEAGLLEQQVWSDKNYESVSKVLKEITPGSKTRSLRFHGDIAKYIVVAKGEFTKE